MIRIYIAGKVTGLPIHEVTLKFGKVQKQLQDMGFYVINPLQVVSEKANGWHTTWQTAMKVCISEMMTADALFLLPCHQDSKGALIEKNIATQLQMPCFESINQITKTYKI